MRRKQPAASPRRSADGGLTPEQELASRISRLRSLLTYPIVATEIGEPTRRISEESLAQVRAELAEAEAQLPEYGFAPDTDSAALFRWANGASVN